MEPDRTFDRLFDDLRLQPQYESMATSAEPPDGLIGGCYPATAVCGRWLPEPVGFLLRQAQFMKMHELFEEDGNRRVVRRLCLRRGRTERWTADNLEEVIQATVVVLNTSHLIPASKRRASNDYEQFLRDWKDSYSLPDAQALLTRMRLIERAADNPLRRMITAEKWMQTAGGDDVFRLLAEIGDRVSPSPDDGLVKLLDRAKSLTPEEKRVVWLRLEDGLTFDEIGRTMGISTTAAHGLFHSAIRKLADYHD